MTMKKTSRKKAGEKHETTGFGEAVNRARKGTFVCREAWKKGTFVFLTDGVCSVENRKMSEFLAIARPDGFAYPYEPTQADVLAYDWKEF